MADIAQIGFRAETGELADAKAKLEAISPAAAKAEQASLKLAKASTAAARAAQGQAAATLAAARASGDASRADIQAASAAKRNADAVLAAARASELKATAARAAASASNASSAALAKEAAAATTAATGIQRMNVAANSNVRSMGAMKANTSNIAAQFQDIGVTAAMGMNPLQVALQQGTQLSAIFAASGESLGKTLATAFGQIISPVALLTIGLVALTVAGLQMVDWVAVAQWGLNQLATILPQVAQGAAIVGAIFAIAFAPAIAASIWAIGTALIMGIMGGIIAIVAAIGAIPILLATVIAGFFMFRDELTQILGFDIVQAARDGANGIIGAIVGAYNAIIAAGATLPAAFGDLGYQIANAFLQGIAWMVREAITMINSLIAKANGGIRGMAGALGMDGSSVAQIPDLGMPTVGLGGGIENPFAGAAASTGAAASEAFDAAQGVDYVGAGLKVIQDGANAASDAVRRLADGLDDVDGKKKKGGGKKGGGGKTDADKFDDIVEGAERRIETLKAERDAIGMSEEASARLKYETEMLNQARQKGIELTPQQTEQIRALAGEMASLEASTKKAQEAFDFAKGLVKGFVSDLRSGLKNGEGFWESFKNAAMNALDKIVDKLLNNVIDAIFQVNAAGSGTGGGGGFLGSVLGWIGGLFGGGSALGNAFDTGGVQAFAKGGSFTNSIVSRPTLFSYAKGGAIGEMGEAGPEAIMPLERGPDGSLGVQMYGGKAPGGGNNITVEGATNIYQISGAISSEDIVAEIKSTAEQTIETTKKSMVGWLNQYSQDGSFA